MPSVAAHCGPQCGCPVWLLSVTAHCMATQRLHKDNAEAKQMKIRAIQQQDYARWADLYSGYAAFYKVENSDKQRECLFAWLLDKTHVCEGLIAERDGKIVGLAHYRAMPSPLRAAEVGFLDDLYVDPVERGSGAAEALLRAVDDIAVARGWNIVRWITQDNNYRARNLYDRLAFRSGWITYEMRAETVGRVPPS